MPFAQGMGQRVLNILRFIKGFNRNPFRKISDEVIQTNDVILIDCTIVCRLSEIKENDPKLYQVLPAKGKGSLFLR